MPLVNKADILNLPLIKLLPFRISYSDLHQWYQSGIEVVVMSEEEVSETYTEAGVKVILSPWVDEGTYWCYKDLPDQERGSMLPDQIPDFIAARIDSPIVSAFEPFRTPIPYEWELLAKPPFFISPPRYDSSVAPNIGHMYTALLSDIASRYRRIQGDAVRFSTGAVGHLAHKYQSLLDAFDISYNDFVEGSESEVEPEKLGYITTRCFVGWYSVEDERFYPETQVKDGVALPTGSKVTWEEKDVYFFPLSVYQQNVLLDWYEEHRQDIVPESRHNEVLAMVRDGLRDVEIPNFEEDEGSSWLNKLLWHLDVKPRLYRHVPSTHIISKEHLLDYAVLLPILLGSRDKSFPQKLVVHGGWTGRGSMSGDRTQVDPVPLLEKYGPLPLRYYLVRESSEEHDSTFSEARMVERYNTELVNNVGNLVRRTFSMVHSYLDSEIPEAPHIWTLRDREFDTQCLALLKEYEEHMDAYRFHKALSNAISLSSLANSYLQDEKPWELVGENEERLRQVLYWALDAIRKVAIMFVPFLPEPFSGILAALDTEVPHFEPQFEWGYLNPGTLGEFGVPFPRIEES